MTMVMLITGEVRIKEATKRNKVIITSMAVELSVLLPTTNMRQDPKPVHLRVMHH
jgi:hypothetical protein